MFSRISNVFIIICKIAANFNFRFCFCLLFSSGKSTKHVFVDARPARAAAAAGGATARAAAAHGPLARRTNDIQPPHRRANVEPQRQPRPTSNGSPKKLWHPSHGPWNPSHGAWDSSHGAWDSTYGSGHSAYGTGGYEPRGPAGIAPHGPGAHPDVPGHSADAQHIAEHAHAEPSADDGPAEGASAQARASRHDGRESHVAAEKNESL